MNLLSSNFFIRINLIIGVLFFVLPGFSQKIYNQISLVEAYKLLEARIPKLKNDQILKQIFALEMDRIDKEKMPDIIWKTDARLQSENVNLELPEGSPIPLEIDQPLFSAKTYLEAQYLILDGGLNDVKKKLKDVEFQTNIQKSDIDRFAIREQVNILFINLEILRSQSKLFDIAIKDLNDRRKLLENSISEGLAYDTELTKIDIKKLEIEAQKQNISLILKTNMDVIEELLAIDLADNVEIVFPDFHTFELYPDINRPEKRQFELQRQAILAQAQMIDVRNKPKLSAFAQAGVGYPNPLNFLENEVAPYGLIGLSFQWKLTDWSKDKIDRSILSLQSQKLQNIEESFDFQLNNKKSKFLNDISRIETEIENKQKILDLQSELIDDLKVQMDEGIINSSEYINQLNLKLKIEQEILVLQTEILKIKLNFYNERGAF